MTEDDLGTIARRTLGHYDANADAFWEGTRDHDVTQNYEALTGALGNRPSLRILDFGCGPGRDLVAFRAMGHDVVGLDGSAEFVGRARERSGAEVWHQSFFDLDLPSSRFDGVFANASLFHVPRRILPDVMARLRACLVPGGVLFGSNPRSFDHDREGWKGERYGSYLTRTTWEELFVASGFTLVSSYLRPNDVPESERPWSAMVGRRT
ncbi:MAG: class I SAM-dependent methyltransferase [Polyangiaceae bacterium]